MMNVVVKTSSAEVYIELFLSGYLNSCIKVTFY